MENQNLSEDRQTISSFYNEFKKQQAETGVNLRHFIVFDKCIKAGLKKRHHILEIGCGIGTFTGLLASFVTKGNIVATDISNESVELARKILRSSDKVKFIVSDMTDFNPGIKFDFVVMVDVLEHIPFDQYGQFFSTLNANTHENSILAINIPHPDMIRFLRKNQPEKLQIIDNSVDMDFLSNHIYINGFRLTGYQTYSIHNAANDYVFMTFEKHDRNKSFKDISRFNIRVRKLIFRFKYMASLVFAR
jgi:trans-aconitate 2-methyltransferase